MIGPTGYNTNTGFIGPDKLVSIVCVYDHKFEAKFLWMDALPIFNLGQPRYENFTESHQTQGQQ